MSHRLTDYKIGAKVRAKQDLYNTYDPTDIRKIDIGDIGVIVSVDKYSIFINFPNWKDSSFCGGGMINLNEDYFDFISPKKKIG